MKQFYKVILAFATVIPAFVSCNKEDDKNTEPVKIVRTVNFSAGEVTKTVFGTPAEGYVPTLWTENKTVGISLNFLAKYESSKPEVSGEGASATFRADIEDNGSSSYSFYAVSPYSSLVSVSSTYSSIQVDIPASQIPLSTSVDESAQILVAKYAAGASFPTSMISMEFEHLTAYGKISFSNLSLADGEAIASVSLTATEDWVGRYYYYPDNQGTLTANSAGKTITLTTTSDSNIWFACAPVDLGGKDVKVVITTDKATTYTKNITIPAGKTFVSGKVNAFTINMAGITADTADEYVLVTSAADLTVGSQVIIAAPGETAMAMSTTQNANNRGATSITKDDNKITGPSDAVQIFTIAEGTTNGTVAFDTGNGYIYAASSSSNWLRTEDDLTANSSWTVSIDGNGIATVVAQGDNTRNYLRYNGTNNPPIFSCYASTSSVDTKVSLYKLTAPDTRAESEIAWSDDLGMGDVKDQELVLPTLTNPHNLTVTYSSSDPNVATVEENAHTVTLLKEGETQIHAVFAGNDDYKPADVYYTLEVYDTREEVTLSFGTASYVLTIGTDDYNNFVGQTATASPSVEVTYALTGDAVGTLNTSNGSITLDGTTTGTATITASFAGDDIYKAANASYTITVDNSAAPVNYSTLETSNVTLSATGGTNASSATVNGQSALKAGTSKNAGAVVIEVPAGTTKLHLHAVGWNGENVTLGIEGATATATPSSLDLTSDTNISGSSTSYSLSNVANYYFCIDLEGITSDTELTFSSSKRFVIWGVNAEAFVDTRDEAGMSWSAENATATYNTGNTLSFDAPTLTLGNAGSVTYSSSDETIATISASGVVSVNLTDNSIKEGSTTIKAIFAGDDNYKPQTVSYTLTVVDDREAVAAPTFSPAAGEVAENTQVSINSVSGATVYYTLDGSVPTTESTVYSEPIVINVAKTVKAIATKTGYRPSAVASATYTIAGGDEPKTSSLVFTAACGGSGTADDGTVWTVTSDGTESNFDSTKGIHYGTGSAEVKYITLTTSDITGTISKVVVNASTASGVSATVGVTVGGNAFGGDPKSLTTSAANYSFEGSASGEIVVTVTKPSKAAKALYVKSIEVTYN